MWRAKVLRIYLEDAIRDEARTGRIDFFALLEGAFRRRGWDVRYRPLTPIQRIRSFRLPGYSLFHMAPPWHARALYLRRAYADNYWRIERSARRPHWGISQAVFDPDTVDRAAAAAHLQTWRDRQGLGPPVPREGFVLVPLQGKLLEQRSFQSLSPIEMVRETLRREPDRPLHLTLHPREAYTARERAAVDDLSRASRVRLVEAPMHELLARADYVVTENSSVAFWGLLHATPAILFAEADFHHPFQYAHHIGAAEAFARIGDPMPDPAKYLYWFFQRQAHAAEQPDAEPRLMARFAELGWPVDPAL